MLPTDLPAVIHAVAAPQTPRATVFLRHPRHPQRLTAMTTTKLYIFFF